MPLITASIRRVAQVSVLILGFIAAGPILTGCNLTENQLKLDRDGQKEAQDYRDALSARAIPSKADDQKNKDIPALQNYVAQPGNDLKAMPLVSISVNQTVPLRDALYELSRQAGYDIELDPRITGSIIFSAKDKPFDVVVDRIADIAGLRYKFNDGSVRIELDTPYQKIYKIDYLAYVRKNKSSVHNDVSVVSGGGADTGSSFSVDAESEADFWGELSTNLQQILGVSETVSSLKTKSTPQISAVSQNPNVQGVGGAAGQPGAAGSKGAPAQGGATNGGPNAAGGANGAAATPPQAPMTTPPQAVLQVNSLPTDADQPAGNNANDADQKKAERTSFSLNQQAGMISVFASERQHKKVAEYLDELRKSVTAQVLIEAKVLEVSLNDKSAEGIDWSAVPNIGNKLTTSFGSAVGLARSALDPVPAPDANFHLSYAGHDASAFIDAIAQFGTVHALASPRLTVLNNQSAVLNVADNLVYFTVKIDTTVGVGGAGNTTTVDSQAHNVPEGVLINVQPSINLEDQTISMAVRPTITRKIDSVNDPAAAFESALANLNTPIESAVPVMNVQEMDSVINVHSGEAIVMGGLMQDRSQSTRNGVPILSEVPLIGAAFRNQDDTIQKTELVVFLKATIIDGSNLHQTDKDLYKQFGADRRPLDM